MFYFEKSGPSRWNGWAGRLVAVILGTAFWWGGGAAVAGEFYENPVIPGDHPDPSIIRAGRFFWATSTSSEWGPQFPLLRSTDLVNWESAGAVFAHRPGWAQGNFWAPEISEFNGKYAVYYAARKRGGPLAVAVATAGQPGGPYEDHGPLVAQPDGSIDPAPATDEHGQRFLIWKEDGNSRRQPSIIWAQRLNDDGTKLLDQPHELIRNDVEWEGGVVEGPFILRHHDWFYLFYSGNGCCGAGCTYAMGVARAHALLGPWEKNPMNPILAANETWKCPGHGSIVEDGRGRYFLLYHAYSALGTVFTGREAMLDEVKFGADDWPTINNNNGPSARADSPFGAKQQRNPAMFSDRFAGARLEPGWQWPQDREPVTRVETGHLVLGARGRATNFLAAVLARSTTSLDYTAAAVVDAGSLKPGVAAGLCAIGDVDNAVGIVYCDGNIITWRRDHGIEQELSRQPAPAGRKIHLILTSEAGYRFHLLAGAEADQLAACGAPAVAKDLPPWDRSVRVGLTVGGILEAEGTFDEFSIRSAAGPTANQ